MNQYNTQHPHSGPIQWQALRRRAPLCSDYERRAVAPEITPLRLPRAL